MNRIQILSLGCFIIGVIFFIDAVLSGDIDAGVILIFPFIIGSGFSALLGILCIFLAFFLFILSYKHTELDSSENPFEQQDLHSEKKTSVKGGGIILIGPVPIILGSNWKIALILMSIALILILVLFYLH